MSRSLRTLVAAAAMVVALTATTGARQVNERSAFAALAHFEGTDLDGRRWSLHEFRGRVVLLDFWATWCAPCLAEFPKLQALRARYPREGFEIIGISLDATSRRTLTSFLNRNRIDWPQIHQRRAYGSDIAQLFGIEQLPVTVLLDRDGTVAAVDLRGDELAARVHQLVTGDQPQGSTR